MIIPTSTKLSLAVVAAIVALAVAGIQASDPDSGGCATDTDCLEKFCMKPGETCDGGPERARP